MLLLNATVHQAGVHVPHEDGVLMFLENYIDNDAWNTSCDVLPLFCLPAKNTSYSDLICFVTNLHMTSTPSCRHACAGFYLIHIRFLVFRGSHSALLCLYPSGE